MIDDEVQYTEEITYTRPVIMIEAVCTCGWKKVESMASNASYLAQQHHRAAHPKIK